MTACGVFFLCSRKKIKKSCQSIRKPQWQCRIFVLDLEIHRDTHYDSGRGAQYMK